jgi:hypothetical protein
MPQFISKLQHKYYEKGEYSDEQIRTLQDTLQLIKDFPWDRERGVDVQLTSPSVVIQDENTNYLKVAIYYNSKYCLYYFDRDHHLYEFHTPDLKDVYELVTGFFNEQIDLQKFEKHTLNIGTHKHFESMAFDYTISHSKFYFQLMLMLPAVAFMLISASLSAKGAIRYDYAFLGFAMISGLLFFYLVSLMIKVYVKSKNLYLSISCGNDVFKFGNGETITEYNKTDIDKVIIYGKPGSTSVLTIIEINFKDGSQIKFPSLLIYPMTFIGKFHDQVKYEYLFSKSQINNAIWNY